MNYMGEIELILGLVLAMAALATAARWLQLPYPILFVLGGLGIAFIPYLPPVAPPPDLILIVFLPPLIYAAGVFISPRTLGTYLRPILLLSIGLVLATIFAIAWLVEAFIPGAGWTTGFILGAIVSTPDVSAVLTIANKVGLRRGVLVILEGESLFSDATSLVSFQIALAAAVTGTFSAMAAVPDFLFAASVGLAIGFAIGWLAAQWRRLVADPLVEIALSLLTPYVAWIPAEAVGASGVLAVAAAAIYVGSERMEELTPGTRLRAQAFWDEFVFLLEGLLFILVGLQLPATLSATSRWSIPSLLGYVLLVSVGVIVVRAVWVFSVFGITRWLGRRWFRGMNVLSWRELGVVAWSGVRGGETLAPALALPFVTASGAPFPDRDLLLFLTFGVILFTLLAEGMTLGPLANRLGVAGMEEMEREKAFAREQIATAVLGQLDRLAAETAAPTDEVDDWREDLQHRLRDLRREVTGRHHAEDMARQRLHLKILRAQREEAHRLHDAGRISDDALHDIEQDLDLEELDISA
ncbi:MAG: Na+/H+ antiporter [Chloroflexota bacterium]